MYEKAEEDAIETQLKERATTFAQELVKVSSRKGSGHERVLRPRKGRSSHVRNSIDF